MNVAEVSGDDNVLLYPNAAADQINLSYNSKANGYLLMVYDVTGELLTDKKINGSESSLDISTFAKGLYFIRLNDGEKYVFGKFIKL